MQYHGAAQFRSQSGGFLPRQPHRPLDALIQRLVRERIVLTVCPLSNVKLCVFPSLDQHNLRTLIDAGVRVTINSDDPAYFGGYVGENFVQTAEALALDRRTIKQIARTSLEGSFAPKVDIERWVATLNALPD